MRALLSWTAATTALLCCLHARADITILKADGTEATPAEATKTYDPATSGWTITLSALYAPGGWTRYNIHGDAGETIDNLFIDVPCLEDPYGNCVPAGSPVIVKVLSDEPDGIATVHNILQTGTAETIINRVNVREDIGSVEADDIGILDAGRDILGPICSTISNNPARGITDVLADRHILGDVTADNGRIIYINAGGDIGTPDAPVTLRARHNIIHVASQGGVWADINARNNGGTGRMYAFEAHTFVGSVEMRKLMNNPYNGYDGHVTILDQFDGIITLGESMTHAERFMQMPPAGLGGQIILNADNLADGAWTSPVYIGPPGESETIILTGPDYAQTASSLGGGSVGLVPFSLHDESCIPANGGVLLRASTGDAASVRLRHYGPLALSGDEVVTIQRRAAGTADPYVAVPPTVFEIAIAAEDANTLVITEAEGFTAFEPGYEYRFAAGPDLRCATAGQPAVAWPAAYLITVELAAPPCPADLDGNGAVDVVDLLALLAAWGPSSSSPADLTGDGFVDVLDLLALLAAWGPC